MMWREVLIGDTVWIGDIGSLGVVVDRVEDVGGVAYVCRSLDPLAQPWIAAHARNVRAAWRPSELN